MRVESIYLRGLAMGLADLVPGISGGTVALITGIYERLINALRCFDWQLVEVYKRQGLQGVGQAVDAGFLLSLLAGILSAVLLLANLMSWLLQRYPQPLDGFFFGLVTASAWVLLQQVSSWPWRRLLVLALGVFLAQLLTFLLPGLGITGHLAFFIGGLIAICAMILPGISGSFLLLIMGLYAPFIEAIKTLDFTLLLPFIGGALMGLLGFSHLLGWLFQHYREATFAGLLGLVLASLKHLWPWQLLTRYRQNAGGEVIPLDTQVLLPWHYFEVTGLENNTLTVISFALAGMLLVLYLARQQARG